MRLSYACSAVIFAVIVFSLAGVSHAVTNLLLNPGAELGTGVDSSTSLVTDWTVGGETDPGRDDGTFDPGINPHSGSFDFYGGTDDPFGTLSQVVDLVGSGVSASSIDSGTLTANISFFEQSLNQGTPSDNADITATFQDASHDALSGGYDSGTVASTNGTWQSVSGSVDIPVGTRFITYTMTFNQEAGVDVDSFVDDNSLTVGGASVQPVGVPLPSSVWSGLTLLGGLGICYVLRRRKAAAL